MWHVLSMYIVTPIPICCFLNMTHTYNFFYFTQALSKNFNPYSKMYWIPQVENVSVILTRSKIPRLGLGTRQCASHTILDRLIPQKALHRVKGCCFPALLRVPLGLGLLHKQNDVSQKCGRGPQAVFTLSPILSDIYHMTLSEGLLGLGALLHGSAHLILSELPKQS